jgi:metal-dependent HD superfamily phosphatase/phosphodiesterase
MPLLFLWMLVLTQATALPPDATMVDRIVPSSENALSAPVPDPAPAVMVSSPDVSEGSEDRKREKRRLVSKRYYKKSRVERALDKELLSVAPDGKLGAIVEAMLNDPLIASIQNYANVVAIQRLGYNDHGPVHARIVALNSLKLLALLEDGGVHPSTVLEEVAHPEDARVAVFIAAFLHDLGMSVTRDNHEWHSVHIADRFLDSHLGKVYDDEGRVWMLKSLINECIIGHMGNYRINSVEAGVLMIGDGADCTKGRAQIPTQLAKNPMIGDIHRFSASAIDSVRIGKGARKPVRIDVHMSNSAGLFQVEEVLIGKAKLSPIMNFLEIAAHLEGKERLYLQ